MTTKLSGWAVEGPASCQEKKCYSKPGEH